VQAVSHAVGCNANVSIRRPLGALPDVWVLKVSLVMWDDVRCVRRIVLAMAVSA